MGLFIYLYGCTILYSRGRASNTYMIHIHIYSRYRFSPQSVFLSIFRRRKYAPFIFVFFSLSAFLSHRLISNPPAELLFSSHRCTHYTFARSFCYVLSHRTRSFLLYTYDSTYDMANCTSVYPYFRTR